MKTKIKIAVIAMLGTSLSMKAQIDSNNNLKIGYQKKIYSVSAEPYKFEMIPFGIGGNTEFRNYYATGKYQFYVSDGTHGNGSTLGFLINHDGNVGIGVPNPSAKLDISGVTKIHDIKIGEGNFKNRINVEGGTTSLVLNSNGGVVGLNWDNSDNVALVYGGGNVGIGVPNPSSKLEVKGDFRIGNGGVYNDLIFKTGTAFSGTNGVFEILPKTMPGSGIAKQTTYFKNAEHSSGKTIHNVVVDGNVGIGTPSPTSELEVRSVANNNAEIHINSLTDGKPAIIRFQDAGASTWGLLSNHPHVNKFNIYNYHKGESAMVFDIDGNVGIGTNGPNEKLHLSSDEGTKIKVVTTSTTGSTGILFQGKRTTGLTSSHYLGTDGESHYNFKINADENLKFQTNGVDKMVISSAGKIGIGVPNPSSKLQLMNGNDGISFDASDNWVGVGFNRSVKTGEIFDTAKSGWQFTARDDRFSLEGYNGAFSNLLNVLKNGNVGIGTVTTGNHKLAVEGSIGAREIKVEAFPNWSDFVFSYDYQLPTLTEVENHIKEKGHLKDIPSAKEVETNGFYLGEMDAKLLQKIEELTLYTIEQEKKINSQNKEIEDLKSQQERIDTLEKENKILKILLEKVNRLEKLMEEK